jgi:hypothetical protein
MRPPLRETPLVVRRPAGRRLRHFVAIATSTEGPARGVDRTPDRRPLETESFAARLASQDERPGPTQPSPRRETRAPVANTLAPGPGAIPEARPAGSTCV